MSSEKAPYLDRTLPIEQRVADLLSRMTIDEKIAQLGFYDENMDFVVKPGAIEVMIGAASDDIRQSGEFEVVGETTEISKAKKFFSAAEAL